MKLDFLNRTIELQRLTAATQSCEPKLIIVYGRRRCGKSRLLNQLPAERHIYHLADLSEPALQRINLANDISRYVSGFNDAVYPNWESLFSSFFSRILQGKETSPYTLTLDEFPYLARLDTSLPSILQKLIDTGRLATHLILCGSPQRMMHDMVLDQSAPLYGRAAEILKIEPLPAGWICDALGRTGKTAVRDYAVWGGVPRYWESVKPFSSLKDAVNDLVFNKHGLFHQEPHRLLVDDMRSDVQPHSLLSVIAGGCHRLSEIAARLGKQAVSLANPLALLMDLGYIKRDIPYGESLRSTKRTLYRLSDPFLLFWYRYVYPSLSLLEQDVTQPVVEQWERHFGFHCGEIWENLARLSVPRIQIGGIQWKEAHRWWGKDTNGADCEVDVVAESIDGKNILIGEAKWEKFSDAARIAPKLRRSAETLPFAHKVNMIHAIWCPDAAAGCVDGCFLFNAEQVLEALR